MFKKKSLKTISTKDVQKRIYDIASELDGLPRPKEFVPNVVDRKKNVDKNVLGKQNYKDLEENYTRVLEECKKWKELSQRYYDEKKFLENKLLGNTKAVPSNILSYKLVEYFKVLNIPGVLSALLIINVILLIFVSFNISKEMSLPENAKKIVPKKVEKPLSGKVSVLPYTIQVAFYENFDDARQTVDILKDKGFSAGINKPLSSDKDIYNVYVGQFATKKEAEGLLRKLKKNAEFENVYIKKKF